MTNLGISAVVMLLLAACGEDDGQGGAPDILLGFSGVVIALLVIWFLVRWAKRRG